MMTVKWAMQPVVYMAAPLLQTAQCLYCQPERSAEASGQVDCSFLSPQHADAAAAGSVRAAGALGLLSCCQPVPAGPCPVSATIHVMHVRVVAHGSATHSGMSANFAALVLMAMAPVSDSPRSEPA